MQEVRLVAPHLDAPGAQEVEEAPDRAILLEIEGQAIPLTPQAVLELDESLAHAPPGELGLGRVVR